MKFLRTPHPIERGKKYSEEWSVYHASSVVENEKMTKKDKCKNAHHPPARIIPTLSYPALTQHDEI